MKADRETVETCPRCMGDGAEPAAVEMSQFAQDVLEMCCLHTSNNPAQYENNVCIADSKNEADDVYRLSELDLIVVRSISRHKGATVFLYRMTAKGDAVMRANWEKKKTTESAPAIPTAT